MSLIRLQNNTPPVYTEESRDFQLLCRLYDCVINGTKYDIDTITTIVDTKNIRTNLLPLLQTKLGFFTNKDFNNDYIRYILQVFPTIVKYKGTFKAIKEAINSYVNCLGYNTDVIIEQSEEDDTHLIIIGLNTTVKDVSILEELFKYILPTGFQYRFYFFDNIDTQSILVNKSEATLLYASSTINSMVRTRNNEEYSTTKQYVNGDTVKHNHQLYICKEKIYTGEHTTTVKDVIGSLSVTVDSEVFCTKVDNIGTGDYKFNYLSNNWYCTQIGTDPIDVTTYGITITGEVQDNNGFTVNYPLVPCYVTGEWDISKWDWLSFADEPIWTQTLYNNYINSAEITSIASSDLQYDFIYYAYDMKFLGVFESVDNIYSPQENNIALIKSSTDNEHTEYKEYVYTNDTWVPLTYIGTYSKLPTTGNVNDIVGIGAPALFSVYNNGWKELTYRGEYECLEDVGNFSEGEVVKINGLYYVYGIQAGLSLVGSYYDYSEAEESLGQTPPTGTLINIYTVKYYYCDQVTEGVPRWQDNTYPIYVLRNYVSTYNLNNN